MSRKEYVLIDTIERTKGELVFYQFPFRLRSEVQTEFLYARASVLPFLMATTRVLFTLANENNIRIATSPLQEPYTLWLAISSIGLLPLANGRLTIATFKE